MCGTILGACAPGFMLSPAPRAAIKMCGTILGACALGFMLAPAPRALSLYMSPE